MKRKQRYYTIIFGVLGEVIVSVNLEEERRNKGRLGDRFLKMNYLSLRSTCDLARKNALPIADTPFRLGLVLQKIQNPFDKMKFPDRNELYRQIEEKI
jgi:hypothetical protein